MAIDLTRERLITLREAVAMLPRRRAGKKVHVSTLYRWTLHGIRGVRLESLQCGGTRVTSVEALERFFRRLEEQPKDGTSPRSFAKRIRDSERAVQELARDGM
jgi:hypothetical protein